MNNINLPKTEELTTVILCGGKGSRVNYQNKPLVLWHGKPLIEYVANSLPESAEQLISANRDLENYSEYGRVVTDSITGLESNSPLVGVLAALQEMANEWLLCVPGDTPLLQKGWEVPLLEAATVHSIVSAEDRQHIQPLHLLLHISERKYLKAYLSEGNNSAIGFLNARKAKSVRFTNTEIFKNFNSAEDFT